MKARCASRRNRPRSFWKSRAVCGSTRCTLNSRRLGVERLEDRRLLDAAPQSQTTELFDTAPALFVENQGQWPDESIRYAFEGSGANVLLTDAGPVVQLHQRETTEFSVLFEGANLVEPVGLDRAETHVNY